MHSSRRQFLRQSLLAGSALTTGFASGSDWHYPSFDQVTQLRRSDPHFSVSLFSKHLHWMGYDELAVTAKELGFDGLDLTVRPGGHVLPENVKRDLPLAVKAAERAGVKINFISTGVQQADEPLASLVLKTAAGLGIPRYRMMYHYYLPGQDIQENIKRITKSMEKLARLNEKESIIGEYQNHSQMNDPGVDEGPYFGATVWDLYTALKTINSPWLMSQYDIAHASIESALSWEHGFQLLGPFISSLHVKDFIWKKIDERWQPQMVELGTGMVNFERLFQLLREKNQQVPITFYYGYGIGDAQKGPDKKTMRAGLQALKRWMV